MKKILSIIVLLLSISSLLVAQSVPQGMKYQAVARNLKGEIMAEAQIVLRISLTSMQNNVAVTYYSELHNVKTNELGLFNLVIGEGVSNTSSFKEVPWSSENIWMEVAIADKSKGGFTVISSSKLLAVPYAFHAETAGKISGDKNLLDASSEPISISAAKPTGGGTTSNTSGNSWNTLGNFKTNPLTDYVGTGDFNDLVFRTNAIERLRITADGLLITAPGVGLTLGGNMKIQGDSTIIDKDLYVGRNVILNYLPGKPGIPSPGVIGNTINRGNFTVSDMSSTDLTGSLTVGKLVRFNDATTSTSASTGALVVTGGTGIGENLNVGGITTLLNTSESSTKDDGALIVEGGVGIEKKLNVGGITKLFNTAQSNTKDDGALVVEGGVGIEKNLNVGGSAAFVGPTDFGGVVTITDITQSTATTNGALVVAGGTGIGKNLNVGGIAKVWNATTSTTSSNGAMVITGGTGIGENLNVGGIAKLLNTTESSTKDDGALVVEGGVGIEKKLNVGGITTLLNTSESSTKDDGALVVEGGVGIEKKLNVGGITKLLNTTESTTKDDGALVVEGGVGIEKNLNVGGILNVTNEVADGDFVATFINTDAGNGDGIKIKLGKDRTIFTPPTAPSISQSTVDQIKDLIRCDVNQSEKVTKLVTLLTDLTIDQINSIAGLAIGVGNFVIGTINELIPLPVNIPALSTPPIHILDKVVITGAVVVDDVVIIPELAIGPLDIPALNITPQFQLIPKIPEISVEFINTTFGTNIPSFNLSDLAFWGIPDLCLTDGGSPLNNNNEFIQFTDKENRKMGSIRAVSLVDWSQNYLNPIFIIRLRDAIKETPIDKMHGKYHFKNLLKEALENYTKLGVEYASNNGDYAEWLERMDTKEVINHGDIVGVIGGKITKDLECAEQVMVVSHNPIVLGNVPPEHKNYQGNNIAFMGQVPVKILGPVATGDYIVGQINTPGYGIAIHPENMTIEDFKLAVGRSWENIPGDVAKMVNTVVGIHNGDYMKILKKFEKKFTEVENKFNDSESRLNSLESKVDYLLKSDTIKKKPF